jgi:hypothetical protein
MPSSTPTCPSTSAGADVDVLSDRRYGERRRLSELTATERHGAARRRYSVAAELAALGVAIVTVYP